MTSANPAVVIGGARGIGKAIASLLAEQPWVSEVVIADLLVAQAQETASEIRALGGVARAEGVDLTDGASIERLISSTTNTRYLAVAAGIFDSGPSLEVDSASFRRVLEVNLIGTFHAVQQYAIHMTQAGEGSIVTVASIAARMPRLRQAAYCASKAGVRQALRVLALETTPVGVRINFVSPGPTDTEMMRRWPKAIPTSTTSPRAVSNRFVLVCPVVSWQDRPRSRPRSPSSSLLRPRTSLCRISLSTVANFLACNSDAQGRTPVQSAKASQPTAFAAEAVSQPERFKPLT